MVEWINEEPHSGYPKSVIAQVGAFVARVYFDNGWAVKMTFKTFTEKGWPLLASNETQAKLEAIEILKGWIKSMIKHAPIALAKID